MNLLKSAWIALAFMCAGPMVSAPAAAEAGAATDDPLAKLHWIDGPADVTVLGQATLKVPEGYRYLERADTAKLQEMMHNTSDGSETLIAPADLSWFALFNFDDTGYVKDNESIDKDAVLQSVRDGTEAANEERRKRGWSEMHVIGWKYEPHYDTTTKRLEWAIIGRSDNGEAINFNTRLLGRKGVMSAVLVASPEDLDGATAAFKDMLAGFEYLSGQRYADVQEGDRIAEYGLAALIAGGAAAVATKKGFWGVLAGFFAAGWKFLAAALVAMSAWLRSVFKKKA